MMRSLGNLLKKRASVQVPSHPMSFRLTSPRDRIRLLQLLDNRSASVVDDYEESLLEYFQVTYPDKIFHPDFKELFQKYKKSLLAHGPLWQQGVWVYFPWSKTLIHILNEPEFFKVRTARNHNLITPKEQEALYNSVVGIAGLSVGSSIALALTLSGGVKHLRLADFDALSLSNTNRILTSIENLGLPKVEMIARHIYELNPYAKLELFPEGITSKNIKKFFYGRPKLDIIVDEVDNLAVKYLIRVHAKKMKIPVVMGADDGDNAVVDIERYDKNPKQKFFHGRLGNVTYKQLTGSKKIEIGRMIARHVGPENVPERMQKSLAEIGRTLVSWPQLGGAALLNGSALAYVIRRIVNHQTVEPNRALISLDEKLVPHYNSLASKRARHRLTEQFKKILGT